MNTKYQVTMTYYITDGSEDLAIHIYLQSGSWPKLHETMGKIIKQPTPSPDQLAESRFEDTCTGWRFMTPDEIDQFEDD